MGKFLDLFSGAGGFSLGAYAAGLNPSLAIDIDRVLTSSFAQNFPATKLVLADLTRVTGTDIEREIGGRIDGVVGGPPCQAFSDIGHRRADDPRRNLLYVFFHLVAELRPTFFVFENVRGLTYADSRPLLERAIDLVSNRLAIVGPLILDAADCGAATRRPRLFVVGYDPRYCDPLSPVDIRATRTEPATVRAAIGDLRFSQLVGEREGFDVWKIHHKGRSSRYAARLRGADATFTGHRFTSHTLEVRRRFASVEPGGIDVVGRHPRLHWKGQCPTLRAGTGNDRGSYQSVRPIHPDEPRVITVREAARLQGFPDWFKFHPTIWHSFRMIGNSVSPIVSQAILSLMAERIEIGEKRTLLAAE